MRAQASSSSSAMLAATTSKSKKRTYSRQELLKRLQILGPLSAPLPPELPPSPPTSRGTTPVRSLKRKQEEVSDNAPSKRPRTSAHNDKDRTLGSEPAGDGEQSSYCVAMPAFSSSFIPVRRPRRDTPPEQGDAALKRLSMVYHQYGRMFKYSGEARFNSTWPSTHDQYRPLIHPPPPGSSYHKHGSLIARLEVLEALMYFVYELWAREYGCDVCNGELWMTAMGYLSYCRTKWKDMVGEQEKAFLGLISMIEAFIQGRLAVFAAKYLDPLLKDIAQGVEKMVDTEYDRVVALSTKSSGPQAPPAMLPSPSSVNSANSTPTSNRTEDTSVATPANGSKSVGQAHLKVPSSIAHPPSNPSTNIPTKNAIAHSMEYSVKAKLTRSIREQSKNFISTLASMEEYQKLLTLPVIAKHFPTTFSRVVNTSLLPSEEYEPDFEDDEGELFWPGQCVTGEGIAWVVLMGKSMIREFGKKIGYKGAAGLARKPDWKAELISDHPARRLPDIPEV